MKIKINTAAEIYSIVDEKNKIKDLEKLGFELCIMKNDKSCLQTKRSIYTIYSEEPIMVDIKTFPELLNFIRTFGRIMMFIKKDCLHILIYDDCCE